MNIRERAQKAKEFAEFWKDKGYEKGETQKFWIQLLQDIFEVENITSFIDFEIQVPGDTNTKFIDAYISSTRILIEQKSLDKDLKKAIKQSDGSLLTPFQQAKKYISDLPVSLHPKYVVTCNFKSFFIYDMEKPTGEPYEILLENLEHEYYRLQFLVNKENEHLKKEMEISIQAGEIVGKLYDEILPLYINPDDEKTLKSLNALCVRLVFCLYAEDAGIFGKHNMFHDYIKRYNAEDLRIALLDLFKVLDTQIDKRDPYLKKELSEFPYVNGGLFADENIEIPNLNENVKNIILAKASEDFDWSNISPTIFGAVFESTLNPETRRAGGMHYTSIENIHKVIDPLFLDELKQELDDIKNINVVKTRNAKLKAFQDKLASLTFLDPACGSGNFLTETYLSLRKIENEILTIQRSGQIVLGDVNFTPIKVSISQFYGIEINDFAVTVAKTALWIAESQMMKQTEEIVHMNLDFLPLKSYANILEANALRIDWNEVIQKEKLNYIMGNPPFVGARLMDAKQKEDVASIFKDVKGAGNLDYVSCWYKKAAEYIENTKIEVAFVSTNSITQGEQVALLWKDIINKGININFAYRTFRWDSEASLKAHVHCVIIGFSYVQRVEKLLYENSNVKIVQNINSYLMAAPNVYLQSRSKPICDVPQMDFGSMPNDGGFLSDYTKERKEDICKKYPNTDFLFKRIVGAEEFINNKERYCIWLKNVEPSIYSGNLIIMDAIKNVKELRENSKRKATKKLASVPYLFGEIRQPETEYLLVPSTSSEKRRYVPIGFFSKDIISSNANLVISNATLYNFGVLTSNVHMAWMRAVAGRLESRYRYSAQIVYNNFPWCVPSKEQKEKIEQTAQAILHARTLYPNSSLADLYDELTMPVELRKAHQENDKAVMDAYGFDWRNMTESECVAELMKMYQKLTGEDDMYKGKIESAIKPYLGKTQIDIYSKLTGNEEPNVIPKNIGQMVTDLIFEQNGLNKNNIVVKNLPVDSNLKPLERMTFRTIKLEEFNKSWEESDWKKYFENLRMYVVCYEGSNEAKNGYRTLKDLKIIEFNKEDLESLKTTYNMVKSSIENNDIELLPYPGSYENQYLEIGPKGAGGVDAYNNFLKNNQTKVCFILNKKFLEHKLNNKNLTHNKNIKGKEISLNKIIYELDEINIMLDDSSQEEIIKILTENEYCIKGKYVIKEEYASQIVIKENGNILKIDEEILKNPNIKKYIDAECKKQNLYKIGECIYISTEKLNQLGFERAFIKDTLNKIKKEYESIDYFSIENIFENEFMYLYEELGFARELMENLLNDFKVNIIPIGEYKLYSFNNSLNINQLFEKIILKYRALAISEIKKIIYSEYKIDVSSQRIRRYINLLDFYYNDILDKVYADKNDYYREVYNEE